MTSPGEIDNQLVFDGVRRGHYEVYYLKVNLPPRAWWIRYTVLSPAAGRGGPVGELWAIAFDRSEPRRNRAFKRTLPWSSCHADSAPFALRIGDATLSHAGAQGSLQDADGAQMRWDLRFEDEQRPFRHFPHGSLYRLPLPKTKVLAPHLGMRVSGRISVGDEQHQLEGAPGHQAHIWGSKHAERWAWANCTAFEGAPGLALECLTARVRVGPVTTPQLTMAALRLPDGRELAFNQVRTWLRHTSRYDLHGWRLVARRDPWRMELDLRNRLADMVGVRYEDPDGAGRVCHNTKVADATVTLLRKSGGGWRQQGRWTADGTAAFEVVEPEADERVPVLI